MKIIQVRHSRDRIGNGSDLSCCRGVHLEAVDGFTPKTLTQKEHHIPRSYHKTTMTLKGKKYYYKFCEVQLTIILRLFCSLWYKYNVLLDRFRFSSIPFFFDRLIFNQSDVANYSLGVMRDNEIKITPLPQVRFVLLDPSTFLRTEDGLVMSNFEFLLACMILKQKRDKVRDKGAAGGLPSSWIWS